MVCVCRQPEHLGQISLGYRWFIFLLGLVETMMWSGTVFGWAPLVHVMKVQGVYVNLCDHHQDGPDNHHQRYSDGLQVFNAADGNVTDAIITPAATPYYTTTNTMTTFYFSSSLLSSEEAMFPNTTRGCDAQDARFALIYVIANVMYAVPGILIGYTLHHLGLAFTRLAGGLMVTGGFILLSLITQGEPDYLWAAVLLLSVGGNTMRMAGLQLADLFPSSGTTAMAIMSGIYTPSAGVMGLLQVMFEMDIAWQYCCWIMAAAAFFIVILTPLFPRHHVPYARLYEENTSGDEEQREEENENGETEGEEENNDNKNEKASIKSSLMSVSSFVYIYWLICNLLGVTLFSTLFNVWINKVATTREETSLYSKLYGWANIMCVAFLPLPGITIKLLDRAFTRGKSGLVALVASLQAMVGPMTVVSLSVTLQIAMMLFLSPWAIYVGLAALMINRTSVLAVGNPFVRVRFPAEHFNRLQGIQDTIISIFTLLQYPHFTWAQHNYPMAIGAMLLAMAVSIVQPLHLLFRQYLTRVLTSPGVITQL